MNRVNIKPLSANQLWQGRKFKTDKYDKYCHDLGFLLPKLKLGLPPYSVSFVFGFSNPASDVDNPIKGLLDIMQRKYRFDDKDVAELHVYKAITGKGSEYFSFSIESMPKQETTPQIKANEVFSWPSPILHETLNKD